MWIQTFTGKKFEFQQTTPDMIDIADIARALSNICRYNGHCQNFYSVAEHSAYVGIIAECARPGMGIHGVLHDAAEAYIGDISTPLKQILDGWQDLDAQITSAIYEAFGIEEDFEIHDQIKAIDLRMLATEKLQLMNRGSYGPDWGEWINSIKSYNMSVMCMPPIMARAFFCRTFDAVRVPNAKDRAVCLQRLCSEFNLYPEELIRG